MGKHTRIVAEYDVVTPMMVGGANHIAEFRLSGFANVARWWWRCLAFDRFGGDEALVYFWDAVIFGWHAEPFGRKNVTFRLLTIEAGMPSPWEASPDWNQWSGIYYLTAQGFSDGRQPVPIRRFAVEVRVPPSASPPAVAPFEAYRRANQGTAFLGERLANWAGEWIVARKTFVDALALLGLIGGMGARSRRGFGSLAIIGLTDDDAAGGMAPLLGPPVGLTDYRQRISRHVASPIGTTLPPYTALSKASQVRICAQSNDVRQLMNEIGWAFQLYRSYGQRDDTGHSHHLDAAGARRRSVAGGRRKIGYQFKSDHDGLYANGFPAGAIDERAAFGLPHNYGKAQIGWTAPGAAALGRRASPLLMHFHKLTDGSCVAAISVLPARLLPSDSGLVVKVGNQSPRRLGTGREPWKHVGGFAEFIVSPTAGAKGGRHGGVVHSEYRPIPATEGFVR